MNRSFSAECDVLGLSAFASIPNVSLSQSLSQRLKAFASHLRKNANPVHPHHQVLNAVSCAAGFPSWDAFGRAMRRLESSDEVVDTERAGLCDVLPLLVSQPDIQSAARGKAFEALAKRLERHTGYNGADVRDALAHFWGARSYHDLLARPSQDESARFKLYLDSTLVWSTVVGPLRELLVDEARRDPLTQLIYAAARRDSRKFADTLRTRLVAIDPAFSKQEYLLAYTAKTQHKVGPDSLLDVNERLDGLCAAYAYWGIYVGEGSENCVRAFTVGEEAHPPLWDHTLEELQLKTTVPCPACVQPAAVAVAYIPDRLSDSGEWELRCKCGHIESTVRSDDRHIKFEPNSTLVTCSCPSCNVRRQRAMNVLTPYATSLRESLPLALRAWAKRIVGSQAPDSALTLGEDGELFEGLKQVGQYAEQIFEGILVDGGALEKALRLGVHSHTIAPFPCMLLEPPVSNGE